MLKWRNALVRIGIIKNLRKILSGIKSLSKVFHLQVPLEHFYSPVPSFRELRQKEKKIWPSSLPESLPGMNLQVEAQMSLFQEFQEYYKTLPFPENKEDKIRYYYENSAYSYSDAIFLHCMIRKFQPKKIIEIGSGFSSCVMMDTNELFLENKTQITFIEPYPSLLLALMKEKDKSQYTILSEKLQDCDLDIFKTLQENDILFVDSTHVSKINSDVNRIIFEILPRLPQGVLVHFHDIFYPFEYPKEWLYEGKVWNEAYLLRAFLQYNSAFKIVFFNTFLEYFYKEKFQECMPLCLKNTGGSLWIKKIALL